MKAYELPATVMANGHLTWPDFQLDPALKDAQVRVIVLVDEAKDIGDDEWLQAAAQNPAFDFLSDPEEDIYELSDGKPFEP
ncbi:hypothetical protein IQ254_09755 [Nodosilinea sp. LEGE 07088]|uniref:hypothetical protein n=1 Tax=Nodosilinea sp. LEGE 07088 TaxID=2777968 RepID=UPI0018812A90|nr:hypothetical protein [Nodosilinea sp. LEGE 07088]MBE9137492.1 hypothetical protein [Nodosilinea sp. LEGE 07088]